MLALSGASCTGVRLHTLPIKIGTRSMSGHASVTSSRIVELSPGLKLWSELLSISLPCVREQLRL